MSVRAEPREPARGISLGLRANAGRFSLLVALNALVGALVGLERSVLPLVGERDFGLASKTAILSFIVAFGTAKALANLGAGAFADRVGRKRLLVLGWALALPVPLLVGLAPSWGFVVVANLFLGASQGLAWSMTVLMKIDLAGPRRRGLALGLNESAGYLGVALAAFATGALAASIAPRTLVWAGAAAVATVGLLVSVALVRDTGGHVRFEEGSRAGRQRRSFGSAFARSSLRDPVLRACSQAGLANNLNDALAWGLAPLYLAANGASVRQVGAVAAVYPAVWGAGQLATGWLSDHTGRKPLIVLGMLVQAAALAVLAASAGAFRPALVAAVLLGVGTALVYPTLIAAVSDAVDPDERAQAVGVYRFWRDGGFVLGALAAGIGADTFGSAWAIAAVAALTGASGLWVAGTRWGRETIDARLRKLQRRISRFEPREALDAAGRGALLVDLRSADERQRHGVIPRSVHIPRSVLEWRLDPDCRHRNPAVADLERELILVCADGFSSSLAVQSVLQLGFRRVGDLAGGFTAWKAAGLPVRPAMPDDEAGELPGLSPPAGA